MRRKDLVYRYLNTNCITISKDADLDTLRSVFAMGPIQFVPVVDELRFVGVIFRHEFENNYDNKPQPNQSLKPYINKEVPLLFQYNTIAEAREVFKSTDYDIIVVVDEDKDLMGLVHREVIENNYQPIWKQWLGART